MRQQTIFSRRAVAPLLALFLSATTASAHTMYVSVTDYVPHTKRGTKLFFGWGETMPIDDELGADWLTTLKIMGPDGEIRDLDKPEKFLTRVQFKEEGTHVLAAELKTGFYTIYKDGDKKKHHMGPKTGLANVEMSLHYCQQGKAIVNSGEVTDNFKSPVGHKLEIIPLKNPALLREGDSLPLKVLFEGEPVPGYPKLLATYLGFSTTGAFAYAKSVVHGRSEVKISKTGVWFVNVKYQAPPTGDLVDKCDEVSYTATLTFEVGRAPESEDQED